MMQRITVAFLGSGILGYQASKTTSREEAAMRRLKEQVIDKEVLFVGIDLHKPWELPRGYPGPLDA